MRTLAPTSQVFSGNLQTRPQLPKTGRVFPSVFRSDSTKADAFRRIPQLRSALCSNALSRMTVDLPLAAAVPFRCRAASPLFMFLYHARARCHGNRCLFASWALSRGSPVSRCVPKEVKVSPTCAPLEPWRGFDRDGDKRPIRSPHPQKLFKCPVPHVSVSEPSQSDCSWPISLCCLITGVFRSG